MRTTAVTRRSRRGESGQSTVEFAIILPILLLVICGIVEFGLYFNLQLSLDFAAREGARYAALHSTDEDLESTVSERLTPSAVGEYEVEISFSDVSDPTKGDVTVTVSSEFEPVTPVGMLIFGGRLKNASSRLTMRVGG